MASAPLYGFRGERRQPHTGNPAQTHRHILVAAYLRRRQTLMVVDVKINPLIFSGGLSMRF
jgi:hypothetical protein